MGRSRIGGTKAKVRGAVGDVVYQVTKNNSGQYQQRVYYRQRERVNNNTVAQAKARMIMGQIQRMYHVLPDLIATAFSTVPKGVQSFWHFAKLNYPILQNDFETHFYQYGEFDWRPKFDVTAPAGIWKLTEGVIPEFMPESVSIDYTMSYDIFFGYVFESQDATVGDLLEKMNMQPCDSLYIVLFMKNYITGEPFISVFSLYVPEDIDIDRPLNDYGDDECPFMFVGQGYECVSIFDMDGNFDFLIRPLQDDEAPIIANFAFIIYRMTDSFPLFSTSQFRWFLLQYQYRFKLKMVDEVFEQWKQVQ